MALILKSAKFLDNTLFTDDRTAVVYLEPADDGDDFEKKLCVKVVDDKKPERVWGGKLKEVHSGRVWKANLKIKSDKCKEHPDPDGSDDGKSDPKPGDTTDVSVTITNPDTSDASKTTTKAVTLLP